MKRPQGRDGVRAKIKTAALFATSVVLVLQLGVVRAMADSSCTLKEVASLPADFSHGNIRIDVGVNGQTVKFAISTGTYFSRISRRLMQPLGLAVEGRTATMNSARGSREEDIVDISELQIGQMKGTGNKFLVWEKGGAGTDGSLGGLLGQDVLSGYDVELDPTENRVNLFLPNPCGGRAVYWWDEYFELPMQFEVNRTATARVTLDGKEFDAFIDTGDGRSSIDIAVAHHVLDVPDDIQVKRDASGDQDGPMPQFSFKELVFGPVTLRNPSFGLQFYRAATVSTGTHIRETIANETPITIGMDVLGKFHTLISYGSRKIYLTLPKERKPQPFGAPKP